jgi:SAM-dependent methyltransferase
MSTTAREIVQFNQRNRDRWVESVAARLPHDARVLDVGAGECRYAAWFTHCRYETHDFCAYAGTPAGALRDTWRYGQIDHVSDITAIPVADGGFDAVLCTEVLEHVPEPAGAIREFARILRPGGELFLSAPLGSGLHQQPHHYYGGYTPHWYRRFLNAAGFEVLRVLPNGGFYRHLLQELNRAAELIQAHRQYSRLHPAYWMLQLGFRRALPRWLAGLDDEHVIDEFTVGYHVEARKRGSPGGADEERS